MVLTWLSWVVGSVFSLAMVAALVYAVRVRERAPSPPKREWATVVVLMTLVYPWAWLVNHIVTNWVTQRHRGIEILVWSHLYWLVELLPLVAAIALGFRLIGD